MFQIDALLRAPAAAAAMALVSAPALAEPRMMAMTALNRPAMPPRGGDGAFRTINHGLDAGQTLWHVRAALNVAALGCEGPGRQATIAAYNRFLTSAKAPLAAANQAIVARYKAQYGGGWTAQYDAYMTSLYNFFSQPFVKSAFCAAAQPLAAETATVNAGSAMMFAAGALPRLEAPFTAFYERYAAYEVALASYNGRYAGGRAPGAPPPPVSPLLDYAAFDAGGEWHPTANAPAAAPIRTAAVIASAAPPPLRYTFGGTDAATSEPEPTRPASSARGAVSPSLGYQLGE